MVNRYGFESPQERDERLAMEREEYENKQRFIGRLIKWGIIIGVTILLLVIAGCSTISYAPQGYTTLVYQTIPNNSYSKTVEPGAGIFFHVPFARTYKYPATQRTYIVSARPTEGDVQEADALVAKCGDSNTVAIESALTFYLNPEMVREFHENIGLKRQVWTDEGWVSFLEQYIRQPQKDAFQQEVKPYTAITASGEGMTKIGINVDKTLQAGFNTYMGKPYVVVVQFQLSDITPTSETVRNSVADRTAAQQAVETSKQQLEAAKYKAEANERIAASLKGNGGMATVIDNAVKSGKVTFWVLDGQNLTVPAPPSQ